MMAADDVLNLTPSIASLIRYATAARLALAGQRNAATISGDATNVRL